MKSKILVLWEAELENRKALKDSGYTLQVTYGREADGIAKAILEAAKGIIPENLLPEEAQAVVWAYRRLNR